MWIKRVIFSIIIIWSSWRVVLVRNVDGEDGVDGEEEVDGEEDEEEMWKEEEDWSMLSADPKKNWGLRAISERPKRCVLALAFKTAKWPKTQCFGKFFFLKKNWNLQIDEAAEWGRGAAYTAASGGGGGDLDGTLQCGRTSAESPWGGQNLTEAGASNRYLKHWS